MNVVPFLVVHPCPLHFCEHHSTARTTQLHLHNKQESATKIHELAGYSSDIFAHNGDSRRAYVTVNCSYPRTLGVNAPPITVEVHISKGLPA